MSTLHPISGRPYGKSQLVFTTGTLSRLPNGAYEFAYFEPNNVYQTMVGTFDEVAEKIKVLAVGSRLNSWVNHGVV